MLKKISAIAILLLLLNACGSAKKAEKNIEEGKYTKAFEIAFTELSKDKNKKSNQKLIPTLKEAYNKAYDADMHTIKMLEKENNPQNLKKIYATYTNLDIRQDDVLSLQPLYYKGKLVEFNTEDYSQRISTAKNNYSQYLYNMGLQQLAGSKLDARKAFKTFNDLEFVNPSYTDNLSDLIRQAKKKGSSFVLMQFQNNSGKIIDPKEIVDLLYVNESNMQNKWVLYNQEKDNNTHYDYQVNVELDKIQITPEQVNTETVPQQARVKDGWEYVYDTNGNVKKDSLGNDIKRDKIITVQAEVRLFQQLKSARIDGIISVTDLNSNSQHSDVNLFGEAKFENIYAKYRGDKRAIEEKYVKALQNKEVPFPKDNEFIKYALSDFKNKMLGFLDQQTF